MKQSGPNLTHSCQISNTNEVRKIATLQITQILKSNVQIELHLTQYSINSKETQHNN